MEKICTELMGVKNSKKSLILAYPDFIWKEFFQSYPKKFGF